MYNFIYKPSKAFVNGKNFIVGIMPWLPYTDELMKDVMNEYEKQQNEKIKERKNLEKSLKSKEFKVASNSDPSKNYIVTLHGDGTYSCDCKGYMFRNKCSHIDQIKREMKNDSQSDGKSN